MMFRDGAMSTNDKSVMGFIKTMYVNQSESYPDIKLRFTAQEARFSETRAIDKIVGDVVDGNTPKRKVYMKSIFERPTSKGYLTLRVNDPQTYPKLFAGYLCNSEDIPSLIEGIKFLLELYKSDALKKYELQLNHWISKVGEELQQKGWARLLNLKLILIFIKTHYISCKRPSNM